MSDGNDKYIGDGVYLSDDGYQLWLAEGSHHNRVIALDPQVFPTLVVEGFKRMAAIHGKEWARAEISNILRIVDSL